jgi:hypothetical protein
MILGGFVHRIGFLSILVLSLTALGAEVSDPPLLLRPIPEAPPTVAAKPDAMITAAIPEVSTQVTPEWELRFGTGVAYFAGNYNSYSNPGATGPLVGIGLTKAIDPSRTWYAGLDAGLLFWSPPARMPGVQVNSVGIQLLPTIFFRASDPSLPLWVDLGVSMGPHFYVEQSPGLPSHMGAMAEILLRPGFSAQLAPDLLLGLETKLGILGSSFIFLPQMGVNLLL